MSSFRIVNTSLGADMGVAHTAPTPTVYGRNRVASNRGLSPGWWLLLAVLALVALAGCTGGIAKPSSGWSGAAVGEDALYIGSREANLLALSRDGGERLWSFPADKGEDLRGIYGTPAMGSGVVFVGAYNGKVYALDVATGNEAWRYPFETRGPLVGAPVVAGDTVIVGSSDGNLYALDAAAGFEKWRFPAGGKIWSTPVVYEEAVYFGSLDHYVYAVTLRARGNLKEGEQMWRFKTDGAVASTPLVQDGRVYIGSFDRSFYALDAITGTEVWPRPYKAGNWFWTRAVSDGATVYVGSLDGKLYALDADTGELVWPSPFETEGPIISAPALVPAGVAVASDDGNVYLVRTEDGAKIRAFSVKDKIRAPLAASDSVLYFSAMNRSVRAADVEKGFWTTLWCHDTKSNRGCE